MEVPTAIATHDFQLSIDGFDEVCCGEGFPHRFWEFQEREIMRPFLAELGDPGGIDLGEAIAKFFELSITDFDIPVR